jgi:hypothetical protein
MVRSQACHNNNRNATAAIDIATHITPPEFNERSLLSEPCLKCSPTKPFIEVNDMAHPPESGEVTCVDQKIPVRDCCDIAMEPVSV